MTLYEYYTIKKVSNKQWSLRALADHIGLNENTLRTYIYGRSSPPPRVISRIRVMTDGSVDIDDWINVPAKLKALKSADLKL